MAEIFNPDGDQHWGVFVPMKCAGTCTRGYAVAMDVSGDITNAATATLHAVCGVAYKSGVAGETILVQVLGYCDYVVTDGDAAAADMVLAAVDGGTTVGMTEAELAADITLGFNVIGRNLGDDSSTAGRCLLCPTPVLGGHDT